MPLQPEPPDLALQFAGQAGDALVCRARLTCPDHGLFRDLGDVDHISIDLLGHPPLFSRGIGDLGIHRRDMTDCGGDRVQRIAATAANWRIAFGGIS